MILGTRSHDGSRYRDPCKQPVSLVHFYIVKQVVSFAQCAYSAWFASVTRVSVHHISQHTSSDIRWQTSRTVKCSRLVQKHTNCFWRLEKHFWYDLTDLCIQPYFQSTGWRQYVHAFPSLQYMSDCAQGLFYLTQAFEEDLCNIIVIFTCFLILVH